ncbi:MAG: RNA polymerase sigma factor RpoH [Magnetococcales bacterium]|nr:RNA polymerase sigma factor RpoH [Magnetococcales bacterium]
MNASRALIPFVERNELEKYMAEINRHPLLTEQAEKDLALRYFEHQDLEAAHRLVTAHLRYVVKIAREYGGYGLRTMDLIQEGSVGLMQAVKRFNPHKGFRLVTYAVWWIRAAMQEFILKSWSLVKIGTTTAQRKLFFGLRKIKQTIGFLDQEQATVIGRRLGVDVGVVLEMDQRLLRPDDSLNRVAVEDGEEIQNLLPDPRANQEARMLESEAARLRKNAVFQALQGLDPRERLIVQKRVMNDHPTTLEEIGKELGVSRERIRQLEQRAMDKLRRTLEALEPDLYPSPA